VFYSLLTKVVKPGFWNPDFGDFPSLSTMIVGLMMKIGFLSKTRSRDTPGYLGDERIRLLRVDLLRWKPGFFRF
jgi:hypothetical protein